MSPSRTSGEVTFNAGIDSDTGVDGASTGPEDNQPRTPFDRLCASGILSPAQQAELTAYRDSLNPLDLTRRIAELQGRLIDLAKDKTDPMRDKLERKHPDTDTGIKIRDVG